MPSQVKKAKVETHDSWQANSPEGLGYSNGGKPPLPYDPEDQMRERE